MGDDQDELPPTTAGPANDETIVVADEATHLGWLAYSQDEPDTVPMSHPWREAWGASAVFVCICAVLAFVIAVVGWVLIQQRHDTAPAWNGVPYTPPNVTLSPSPTATAAPLCAPGHNADPGCLPVPVPVTSTVTAAPPPVQSAADFDERFLTALTDAGLRISDAREAVEGGRQVCPYLAEGHTEAQAVQLALSNNSALRPGDARIIISTAVRVYCPEQAD